MSSILVESIELEPFAESGAGGVPLALSGDLSLVGHVQVRLTAALGEMELPLSELFDLKTGAVLRLDRSLDEPVTLSLNGKPVATAHLVAVGDHFGVQIERVF
jgi:flagellar motor switch protein FliN/FliY